MRKLFAYYTETPEFFNIVPGGENSGALISLGAKAWGFSDRAGPVKQPAQNSLQFFHKLRRRQRPDG
jgi:hypothetical protein